MAFIIKGIGTKLKIMMDTAVVRKYVRDLSLLSTRLGNLEYTETGFNKSVGNSKEAMQTMYDDVIEFSTEFKGLIDDLIVYLNDAAGIFEKVDDDRVKCAIEDKD